MMYRLVIVESDGAEHVGEGPPLTLDDALDALKNNGFQWFAVKHEWEIQIRPVMVRDD
jgi:hypothetical protein